MVRFGSFHPFQNSMVHKTFSSDFGRDLEWHIFSKTATCKDSKKFWCTSQIFYYGVIRASKHVKTRTNAKMLQFFFCRLILSSKVYQKALLSTLKDIYVI